MVSKWKLIYFVQGENEFRGFCGPRKGIAPFFYELSLPGPMSASIQTDADGRDFLIRYSNGEKGFIRNDIRIMISLKEISPIVHKVGIFL